MIQGLDPRYFSLGVFAGMAFVTVALLRDARSSR